MAPLQSTTDRNSSASPDPFFLGPDPAELPRRGEDILKIGVDTGQNVEFAGIEDTLHRRQFERWLHPAAEVQRRSPSDSCDS